MNVLREYRILEGELYLLRMENPPGALIEEPVIDEMARLWDLLSDNEKELLDKEGPRCWPPTEYLKPLNIKDVDTLAPGFNGPVRRPPVA